GNDKGTLFHYVSNAINEQVSSVVDVAGPKQGAPNANESMADSYIVGAFDASGTNSLGNEANQVDGPKITMSFALVIKINNNKVVQITELRNEEHVEGAAVTLPLSAIKEIGKPIWIDTYTGNMCLNSWGRSAYARALIEILADEVLKEDLRPPRCSTCLIFDHVNDKCLKLPKFVSSAVVNDVIVDAAKHSNGTVDDGLEVVKKKRNRKKKHQKQVDGVVLSKPSLNLHYRPVDKENSTKGFASTNKVGKSTSTDVHDKNVRLENSFIALNDDEESDLNDTTTWQHTQQVLNVLNESDSDVDEEITLDDHGGNLKTT
nr:hypothetical protein [Tanacetum cinerariifolium]